MKSKRKSIITWTVQRISAVFLAVIFALIVFFLSYITRYMKDSILDTRRSQVEMGAAIMESRLDSLVAPIVSLSQYTPVSRLVSGYYTEYSPEWMNAVRSVDAYLLNTSLFSSYIMDINLIGEDGEAVYSLNDILKKNYPYTDQVWFTQALAQETVLKFAPQKSSDHLYYRSENPSFSLIYPIGRGERVNGYVLMEIDLYRLADFLKKNQQEDNGYLITDELGRIIAGAKKDTDEEAVSEALAASADLRSSTSDDAASQTVIWHDKDYYYIMETLEANRWTVMLQTSRDVILSPVRKLVLVVCLLAVAAIFLLLLILRYSAKRIGKPLHVLVDRINAYDGSQAAQNETYENAPAEVAVIGERFEAMTSKISGLIQDVYVAELRQKEAELEALVNQINPHFLYNVLQLIETKAVLSDNREIEDMIQALSQMMRYTMERKERKVHVREELEYIQNYLMFYQNRFPGMFMYEIICPEELENARMLKFLIQPVVENSIRHGFDQTRSDGNLKIVVEEDGDDLKIAVWDNGKGISSSQLAMLQRSMSREKEPEEMSPQLISQGRQGIGVVNTDARIRLVYGDHYGLFIESREQEYTLVTIKIRLERDNDV